MRIGTRRGPVTTLLLLLLTCGLYYFYWVYVTSQEIQDFTGERDIPPIVELLLTLFTGGLYLFYWDWKTGKNIARMQERVGIPSTDNSVMYLVFDILGAGPIAGLGIICPILQQVHLNEIWSAADARRLG